MATKREVKKVEPAGVPGHYDYGEDAGVGYEGMTSDDYAIPFVTILQTNSPEVEDNDPKGAKPGLLFNKATRELYESIVFQPCHRERTIVEWVPRDDGGGLVGFHDVNSDLYKDAVLAAKNGGYGRVLAPNGNHLVNTVYIYGQLLDEAGANVIAWAVLTFSSTRFKPLKNFNSATRQLYGKPPPWATRVVISTFRDENKYGKFYNFRMSPLKDTWLESLINPSEEKALLIAGKDFRDMVLEGKARADFSKQDQDSVDDDTNTDSDVPF
jgi:hypothetical protein